MKDGMYTIEYVGTAGSGHCTLVFDGGRIYGVDPMGGKYDGQYRFNQDTGLVDATIRVEMPGGVPSVVGIQQPFDWILEVSAEMNPDLDEGHISAQTNLGQPINAYYRFIRTLPQAA